MSPTSALCRAQEALQRDRAAGTSLANVRAIAQSAADAWCIEAVAAEKRELQYQRPRPGPAGPIRKDFRPDGGSIV